MSDDLRVLTSVTVPAVPVIAALHRLQRDVGSLAARFVDIEPPAEPVPDDLRFIAVTCADGADIDTLAHDLAVELRGDPEASRVASKVAILETAGRYLVVFLLLPCVRA